MSKQTKSHSTSKKTRSSTSSAVASTKKSSKVSKGVKTRDRANVESMNSLDSVGDLQNRLGNKGQLAEKKHQAKKTKAPTGTAKELTESLARTL